MPNQKSMDTKDFKDFVLAGSFTLGIAILILTEPSTAIAVFLVAISIMFA